MRKSKSPASGMPRVAKKKTHKPLYAKKVDMKTYKKIDSIVEALDVSKWVVIDKILSEALGIKTNNPIDLSKWLKTN